MIIKDVLLMSTVAIVGVASHFARALLPLLDGDPTIERIIGVDVRPPSRSVPKLTYHRCDVRDDPVAIAALLQGAQTVIHLAFIVLRPANMPMRDVEAINLDGTRNVCEAAVLAGARKLIIASSVAAYGVYADNPPRLTEESPLRGNPDVYYSKHKAANERFLDEFQTLHSDLIITRFRPCIVTSSEPQGTNAGATGNAAILIRGNSMPVQFVHDSDLAAAFHMAVTHDIPGAYNVAPDDAHSQADLAAYAGQRAVTLPKRVVVALAGTMWRVGLSPLSPEWAETLASGSVVVANDKLKAAGWTPHYSTRDAYKALVDGSRKKT